MRILSEIIEDVKAGGKPEYDELRFALLAYNALLFFADRDVRRLSEPTVSELIKKLTNEENFNRHKKALEKDPKVYIGNDNPDLPEYQEQRKQSERIFNGIMKKIEQNNTINKGE